MSALDRLKLGLIVLLLVPSGSALAAHQGRNDPKVAGACAGDVVSGRFTLRAPRGTILTARLFKQARPRAGWTSTNRAKRFRSLGGRRSYAVRFDVAALDAYAYRLGLDHAKKRTLSRPITAAACAPGAQVPEAPFALLLPLSLLGTAGLLLRRRRSH